jgi:hypothetical protein
MIYIYILVDYLDIDITLWLLMPLLITFLLPLMIVLLLYITALILYVYRLHRYVVFNINIFQIVKNYKI